MVSEDDLKECLVCAVLVRRTIRGGGDVELERNEPEPEPVARVVLVRPCSAKLRVEDMEGSTRERGGRSEGFVGPCQGQLVGTDRKVL
jgi:hypothetical protein